MIKCLIRKFINFWIEIVCSIGVILVEFVNGKERFEYVVIFIIVLLFVLLTSNVEWLAISYLLFILFSIFITCIIAIFECVFEE